MTVKVVLSPALVLQFNHDLALIGKGEAEAIARHMGRLLEALCADASRALGTLELLDDRAQAQLRAVGREDRAGCR